jgi:alpha-galactosidase
MDRNSARIVLPRGCLVGGIAAVFLLCGCEKTSPGPASEGASIEVRVGTAGVTAVRTTSANFEILPSGYIRSELPGRTKALLLDDVDGMPAETVVVNGREINDWVLDPASSKVLDAQGPLGKLGKRIEQRSISSTSGLERFQSIEFYGDFPSMAFSTVSYKNIGAQPIQIDKTVSQRHRLSAVLNDPHVRPFNLWSFHGSSAAWGQDNVVQLSAKFARPNIMHTMMHNDENQTGGGVPVIAFWTPTMGEAIGHVELLPIPLAMPVQVTSDGRVEASIVLNDQLTLEPGKVYSTPLSFVAVYKGDFYEPLRLYSLAMQRRGWEPAKPNDADYQPNWCGWGYEMDFTPQQMVGTIPKLKELGLKWATLDAGWFTNRGDWEPRPATFPDDALKKLVQAFHKEGIHLTLWWIPIVAEDGKGKDILSHKPYAMSAVVRAHPEWLILDQDGKPARMTANLGGLCPALPQVQEYYRKLTEKFIRDWDFDGHKLDFSYTVPPCFNPKHHHNSPNDSIYAMGEIYKIIFQTTRALKPESVTQSCPCGTPPNVAWLAYIDQAVTADPVGSAQVRLRTKMYKALLGPQSAVYGDHVELTKILGANTSHEVDVGKDFASSVGTGAVLGTKFTWPDYGPRFRTVMLTAEKERLWKKWIDIYDSKMLSRGIFRDLYVYGVDFPEAYAIEKDGKMYYSFFTANETDTWKGTLELRGLNPGRYTVVDYVNGASLGTVDGATPKLPGIQFTDHLLLEVSQP